MSLREAVNGSRKPLGIGAVTGVVVALIAFVTLHMTLRREFRTEGATSQAVVKDVERLNVWVADYERNVRPLRDEFLRLTGELKRLPEQIAELKTEMRRLNDRLDRVESHRPGGSP